MLDINIQKFGGRGAGSRITNVSAIKITFPNNVVISFRDIGNGHFTDLNMTEPKDTNGLSLAQIAKNAKERGATIQTYSKQELKKVDADYSADRKATDEFLDRAYVRNKGADTVNKGYRNTKKANRLAKR